MDSASVVNKHVGGLGALADVSLAKSYVIEGPHAVVRVFARWHGISMASVSRPSNREIPTQNDRTPEVADLRAGLNDAQSAACPRRNTIDPTAIIETEQA